MHTFKDISIKQSGVMYRNQYDLSLKAREPLQSQGLSPHAQVFSLQK